MKIRINMLSNAESVIGQGVASAYREQINLMKELDEYFEMEINSHSSKFDIFHIHSPDLWYKLRINKKHLNIVHVHFVPSKNDGSLRLPKLANFIFNKYVEGLYRKADELVVVNPCFINDLEKLKISNDKITYIPNYVDKSNFYSLSKDKIAEIRQKYSVPQDAFVVLGCGQIQTRKGFEDFVEVARNCPNMYFVWAGGFSFGKLMHGYKKNKELLKNLPQNMVHLGIIDRNKMNEIFNMSDVLFMPSYMELFPMTILEICNIGRPILVRDLELYKPILFGKYCKGQNNQEFINELNKLRHNTTYYNTFKDGSLFISNFYNKDVMKNTWKDYYCRVYDKWISKKSKKN